MLCAETANFKLYCGDIFTELDNIPDASVDMIYADPPYFLSNEGFTCKNGKQVSVNKGKWDQSQGVEADLAFHDKWIALCKKKLKPDGTIWISGSYHSIYQCGYALQKQNWRILNDICWYKPNAPPNLSCRMFTASHESIIWASPSPKSKHAFNYEEMKFGEFPKDPLKKPDKQMRSVWQITPPCKKEKNFGKHPTQKPEALLRRIILASTNKGDVILDPFCGSGTTGVVAINEGRKFIGIDANLEYLVRLALPRILSFEEHSQAA